MPRKMKDDIIKYCLACSKQLIRKRYKNSLEGYKRFSKRQHCDENCMALTMINPDASRSAIQKRISIYRKSECEKCNTNKKLTIHHIDGNWKNNVLENLMTLCSSCHMKLHHRQNDIFPIKEKPPCYVCQKKSYKQGLCNTCRSRKWRTGSEYKSG